jgi:hypothetical protein
MSIGLDEQMPRYAGLQLMPMPNAQFSILPFALSLISRAEETCLTNGIHMTREKRKTGHHRRVESGFVDCIEFGGKLWQK